MSAEGTLQAAVAQHERTEGVLAQRLHTAGAAIAGHEEMAHNLVQEIRDVRAANAGGDNAFAALSRDLKAAHDTVAAHERAAGNVKGLLTQLQTRNAELGEIPMSLSTSGPC